MMHETELPGGVRVLGPRLARLPGIAAGFSTRLGGMSRAPYASLNLGSSTRDDEETVQRNREIFFESAGISSEHVALAGQVHGSEVAQVDNPGYFASVDGFVTTRAGLALTIGAADCAVILLADPEARVVGACHSGWRGTAANIVQRAVDLMTKNGASAGRIHAFVSPCISVVNFEVGPEVAAQFDDRYVVLPDAQSRPHVDLRRALRDQLIHAGVTEAHLEVSPYCTVERTDLFFSHRREGGITGRMMGFIVLQRPPSQIPGAAH